MSIDRKIESINFAQESTKQILALCTAILTLTAGAVSVDAINLHGLQFCLLLATFFVLLMSIGTGIIALFALAGILSSDTDFSRNNPLDSKHYKFFGRIQFGSFGFAVLFMSAIVLSQHHEEHPSTMLVWPKSISCNWQKNVITCYTK
jgi:hypothetical protein